VGGFTFRREGENSAPKNLCNEGKKQTVVAVQRRNRGSKKLALNPPFRDTYHVAGPKGIKREGQHSCRIRTGPVGSEEVRPMTGRPSHRNLTSKKDSTSTASGTGHPGI